MAHALQNYRALPAQPLKAYTVLHTPRIYFDAQFRPKPTHDTQPKNTYPYPDPHPKPKLHLPFSIFSLELALATQQVLQSAAAQNTIELSKMLPKTLSTLLYTINS